MATRQHKNTAQYSPLPLPLAGTEQVEVWRDGKQYQTTLDVLGGNPGPHGESHESGTDKIGTQTPTADAIVRGDDNGQVNDWVADASTSVKGKVQLAAHNEEAANKVMQSDDPRNKNARPPTAHAASHLGGPDDLGLGTAALLDVDVANGVCGLDSSGLVSASKLPSYVDDVVEAYIVGSTAFDVDWLSLTVGGSPLTPESGKIYLVITAGNYYHKQYRWTGSVYGLTGSDLALGETSSTAYRGDRGKTAYDHSQTAHAPSNADNTQAAIVAASSKTTPVDADTLALIDSEAGGALKELLWSRVKATLKTYFDTLYTSSGGDTPANILAKLVTVDGYTSGIVSEDSGKLNGKTYNIFNKVEDIVSSVGFVDWLSSLPSPSMRTVIVTNTVGNMPYAGYFLVNVVCADSNTRAVTCRSLSTNVREWIGTLWGGIFYGWHQVFNSSMSDQVQLLGPGGTCLSISGQDIHTLRKTGQYMGAGVINAPDEGWWYFDIKLHGGAGYEVIDAYSLETHGLQYRKTIIAGSPSGWSSVWNDINDTSLLRERGVLPSINLNSVTGSGVYRLMETGLYSEFPVGALPYGQLTVRAGSDTGHQEYVGNGQPWQYKRTWYRHGAYWSPWSMEYTSANVGAGWPAALAADVYSLGTRELTTTSTTSNEIIPAGKWIITLTIDPGTTGRISIQTASNGWRAIFQALSTTVQTTLFAGAITSDGTNVRVERVTGQGTVYIDMIRIG